MHKNRPEPSFFVIFGGAGDLSWRKLIPALYDLFLDGWLPEEFAVLGTGRKEISDDAFRSHAKEGVDRFSRGGKAEASSWKKFEEHLAYMVADLTDPEAFTRLAKRLDEFDRQRKVEANRIFYLAIPPETVEQTVQGFAKARLNKDRKRSRIVVEKPFGHDLASAGKLDRTLTSLFQESQIFRIDHYLGKETVQNILAFRFGNSLFEPIWNRRYIDHVQITVAEEVGVEHRGGYYEQAGALRDMIQNHLLQVLCLIAMEAPVSFASDEVRNKKVDVLHAIRPIHRDQIHQFAVRGQYSTGWIEGKQVTAYRREPDVATNSTTETFAALKLLIDNWRWQGVPFYLRTGKRLPARTSEVCISFRPVPHQAFPASALMDRRPNRLLIAIQPSEGILLRFEVKHPGPQMYLSPVLMQFYYREAFQAAPPEAYETLLLDIMRGDATLFMRADQAEAAWSVITPVLEAWQNIRPTDFPNYQAGTWGPEAAEILIAQDGRNWVVPTHLQCQGNIAMCRIVDEQPS